MPQSPLVTLNDGTVIPQVGFGVWQVPNEQVVDAVLVALGAAYRHIDTAAIYRNESGVGEALKQADVARDDIFVTSKLWNADQGFDSTLKAFDATMKRLGLDVLDLYLIHWPVPMKERYLDTWKAMIRLREEGRIRSIGVSNFNRGHIEKLISETGVVPSVNQIELHPRFQQKALRGYHEQHGIVTESWSPSGSGRLLGDPLFAELGEKHGKSPAQVIFRWHVQEGLIVLPKSVTPSRIRENIDIFDFALDEDDMVRIGAMDAADGRNGPDPETNEN